MKLLLDQNLSPRLVGRLASDFPGSVHVSSVGLATADDRTVWGFARNGDYAIVSKDADFGEIGLVRGFPPWVVWIRRGNCSTSDIEAILREGRDLIEGMAAGETGVLELF